MKTVVALVVLGAAVCYGAIQSKRISGTVIYSFSENHSLIQTASHIYRIRREFLSGEQWKSLDRIGSTIVVSLPTKSIDMAWRIVPKQVKATAYAVTVEKALADEAVIKNGILSLRGTPLPSFQDSHYLIQVGNFVYRIRQASVGAGQRAQLSSIGSRVQLKVKYDAVDFSWAVDGGSQTAKNIPASSEPIDEIRQIGKIFLIRGRLLPSFNDPHYLIQVGSRIYWIQKSNATREEDSLFSKIGSQVSLKVPPEKIELSWSVDNGSNSIKHVVGGINKVNLKSSK